MGPILAGSTVVVLVLSGLVYYLANRDIPAPEATKSPQAPARMEYPASERTEDRQGTDSERSQRETALEKERDRLAQDQRRLEEKQRQADAQQAKETAERKQLESQRTTSSRERELAAQRAREDERKRQETARMAEAQRAKETVERKPLEAQQTTAPRERELAAQRTREEERTSAPRQNDVQVANAFPDQRLRSLLEQFRQAYENHDLATIQSISHMSDDRLRNVQVMFANYETIRASIKDLVQTEQGASATLFLDSVTTAGGETVSLSPLARKFNLKIPRQGAESDKIIW